MADFTEQQVFDALGLGEQEQEAAAPAPGGDTAPETNEAERTPQETPGDGAGGEEILTRRAASLASSRRTTESRRRKAPERSAL